MLSGVGMNVQRREGIGFWTDGQTHTCANTYIHGDVDADRDILVRSQKCAHTDRRDVKSQCTFAM